MTKNNEKAPEQGGEKYIIEITITCRDKEQYDKIMQEVRTLFKQSKLTGNIK